MGQPLWDAARRIGVTVAVLVMLSAQPLPSAVAVPGDCNGDGVVKVSELIVAVNVLLDRAALSDCTAADLNQDGKVSIDELVQAVRLLLNGAATPTSTATARPSATATTAPTPTRPPPTPTRSATVAPTEGAAGGVATVAQAAGRLPVVTNETLRLLETTLASLGPSPLDDPDDACPTSTCAVADGQATLTVTYAQCESVHDDGSAVVRQGTITATVPDPTFCTTRDWAAAPTWQLQWQDFILRERSSAGTDVAQITATVTAVGTSVAAGCAGPGQVETIDGSVTVQCQSAAASVACPPHGAQRELDATGLILDRRSGGFPCERSLIANGDLTIDDALTGDHVTQTLHDFAVNRTDDEDGEHVTLTGSMSVACLGDLNFVTEQPLVFAAQESCPAAGIVHVTEGIASTEPMIQSEEASGVAEGIVGDADTDAANSVEPSGAFRDQLFRATNGQVYQVVQNAGSDAELGADALQITTVVGVAAESIAQCATSAGARSVPQAVVAAESGTAVLPESVVRSMPISDASVPCFNRNGANGNGLVCIGPGCAADCSCASVSRCTTFTQADGGSIARSTDDIPPATLVEALAPLRAPCSGFEQRATYRFGDSGPSTESAQCAAAPSDGFSLPATASAFPQGVDGTSVIFVYSPPPLAPFSAGAAGFPIDVDGVNRIGCSGTRRVLSLGRATFNTVAGARITYAGGGVAHDYDSDGTIDKTTAVCDAEPLRPCAAVALPTPSSEGGETTVASGSTQGTTTNAANRSVAAPCNWGGGKDAPDVVYEYEAPETGTYAVRIRDASFDPLLWVKEGSCTGSPLACAYDGDGSRAPEAEVGLQKGQRIAVIVDGNDGESGSFALEITQRQPDLVVTALTAPDQAVARDQALVSAEILNQGDGDAGPFDVQFVYTRDAARQQPILIAVLSCGFAGLPAGQKVTCGNPTPIDVPIVAAGQYFLSAIVDAREQVRERAEDNNARTVTLAIRTRGAELEHLLLRADDGTAYQVINAIPTIGSTDAESYWITTVAGSQIGLEDFKNRGDTAGAPVCALIGGDQGVLPPQVLHPFSFILRTAIIPSSDSTLVRFDPRSSGKVVLGGDTGGLNICIDPRDCPNGVTEPLVGLDVPTGGVSAGCVANEILAPCAPESWSALAFGLDVSNNVHVCDDGQLTTTSTTICAQLPLDGFGLRPGQSVVFVFRDLTSVQFAAGVAGFAIDEDGTNSAACPANTILLPFAETALQIAAPLTMTPTPSATPTPTPPECALAGHPTCTVTATNPPFFTPTFTPTPLVCRPDSNYLSSLSSGIAMVPGTSDIGNHCDDCATNVALPFTYNFYGQPFSSVYVSSNGNLQFSSASGAYGNVCLPILTTFSEAILAYWDDLYTADVANGQGIFSSVTGDAPNRIFNLEWRANFCCTDGPPENNFEVRLYEGQDKFDIIYGAVPMAGGGATVGVQRDSGLYSQFECSASGGLSAGLQLTFTQPQCESLPTQTPTPVM